MLRICELQDTSEKFIRGYPIVSSRDNCHRNNDTYKVKSERGIDFVCNVKNGREAI